MSDPIGAALSRFQGSISSPIQQGGGIGDTGARQVPVLGENQDGPTFADSLTRAINEVSAKQDTATGTLDAFLRGENIELHQVMAATEEAQLSLELLIEVRNKFADAYRSLTNMQG